MYMADMGATSTGMDSLRPAPHHPTIAMCRLTLHGLMRNYLMLSVSCYEASVGTTGGGLGSLAQQHAC